MEIYFQQHLKEKRFFSCIFLGAAGSGKTSLIKICAFGDNYEHSKKDVFEEETFQEIVDIDRDDSNTNDFSQTKKNRWLSIASSAKTIFRLIDSGGREKDLRKIVSSVFILNPGFSVIAVNAEKGVDRLTLELIGLVIFAEIEFCFSLTRCKNVSEVQLHALQDQLRLILSSFKTGCSLHIATTPDDLIAQERDLSKATKVALLQNSASDFPSRELLHSWLRTVALPHSQPESCCSAEFSVFETRHTKQKEFIICGYLRAGTLRLNDQVYFGPSDDAFLQGTIKSIHAFHQAVEEVTVGQICSLCIKNWKPDVMRRLFARGCGIYAQVPCLYQFIEALLLIVGSSPLEKGKVLFAHCHLFDKSCEVIALDSESTSKCATVRVTLKFMNSCIALKTNSKIILRGTCIKAVGVIIRAFN